MKWRIVRRSDHNYVIQKKYLIWPFWLLADYENDLEMARLTLNKIILARHRRSVVVDEITDEAAYVLALLQQ